NVIVAGADKLWASCMLLYLEGKDNATVRARTYTDLTNAEKLRESIDIKATNIVLQGLP
ncbi:hypothetical protein Tco_0274299, partial [Tanacetum coccineum]